MLMVSTAQEIASPKKEVLVTESGIFTKNNLSHLYQLGYDEVEIQFADVATLEEIKKRLPECLGWEIIDQKKNKLYIRSIATTLETEFDILLRKSFQLTNEMAKSVLEALQQQQYSHLSEIRNLETLNNKFTDICIRILNKRGYKIPSRTMQIYEVVKNLERIADEFKYICDLLIDGNGKGKLAKEALGLFKDAVEYYLAFYELFYKFDPELKKRMYEQRKVLLKKGKGLLEKSTGVTSMFMYHTLDLVQNTYDGAGGYFALML